MVVRGSACRAAIWTSRRSTPASSMVVTKVWRSMCGCGLEIRTPAASARRLRRRVAAWRFIRAPLLLSRIGPRARGADRPVDGPPDRRRQRDQDDLGALSAYAQHPMAMFFAEVGDI